MLSAGAESFTYDDLDRIQTQTFGYITGSAILTTTYGGRKDGLRNTLSLTLGGTLDFINQYDYDERLWLKNVTQTMPQSTGGHFVATKQVVFQHGDDGRLEHLLRYADLAATQFVAQTDFGYDASNRLNGINHWRPATGGNVNLATTTWDYDAAGRIRHLTNPNGQVTYGYDDRGQLTGADYTGASQPADAVYNYDGNGNRTDTGFVTGDHNQPQTDGTYGYTYDAEGNRIGRTNLSTGEYDVYQWDNRNRLTGVIHHAVDDTVLWSVSYQYDYLNRLVTRTETVGNGSPQTQQFVYDGDQMVLATDAGGNVTHRYLWGESVDQILADETVDLVSGTSQTRWTLTDHLNTVRDIATYDTTTDTTSIVDHIIYDAFGQDISESSPTNSTSLKFTGHYLDPLTGHQWNLNRWYDPGLHQWLSVDPILFDAGDANPRRYVNNDPVNRVDPSGLAEPSNVSKGEVQVSLDATELDLQRIAHDSVTGGAYGPLTSQQSALYESRLSTLRQTINGLKAYNATIRSQVEWQTRVVEYQGMRFEIPALQDYCEWTDELEQGLEGLSPRDRRDALVLQSLNYQQFGSLLDGLNDRLLVAGIQRASAPLDAWVGFVHKAEMVGKLVGSGTIFVSSFVITWTGEGAIIGVPGMIWSADQFQSALGEIVTGNETKSIGHRLAVGALGDDGGAIAGTVYDTVPGVVFACPELSMGVGRSTFATPTTRSFSTTSVLRSSPRVFASDPRSFGINLRPTESGLDLTSVEGLIPAARQQVLPFMNGGAGASVQSPFELPPFDGTTRGYIMPLEPAGPAIPISSGPRTGARFPFSQADGHLETNGALLMADNNWTRAAVFHNNPSGTCPNCDMYLPTFLQQNSVLEVFPPPSAVPRTPRWIPTPKTYSGNSASPY